MSYETPRFDPFGASNYKELEKIASREELKRNPDKMREEVTRIVREAEERFEGLKRTQGMTSRTKNLWIGPGLRIPNYFIGPGPHLDDDRLIGSRD